MASGWTPWIRAGLDTLRERHLFRTLRPISLLPRHKFSPVKGMLSASMTENWASGNRGSAEDSRRANVLACDREPRGEALHEVTLFSTNDYLGLSFHPRVRMAMQQTCGDFGSGLRSSALVAGHTAGQQDLASALARLKKKDDCVLFPSGFGANMAVASCLASSPDVEVFSDELNHASIIDGLRMAMRGPEAKKRLSVYRHCDMVDLEKKLSASKAARKMVITDSLFSMDGDIAPLTTLVSLRRKYGFLLVLDDAHASLVFGTKGGGVAEEVGVESEVDIVVGTLSKAVGQLGGFVCASSDLCALLTNAARPMIYSTALPEPVVRGALAALEVNAAEPQLRETLWARVRQLESLTGTPATSPIVPIIIGPSEAALEASRRLLQRGFHVPAIRPPTVPEGSARLRVALSAAHSEKDVDLLAAALREAGVLQVA